MKQLEHHLTFSAGELSPTLWGRYDLPLYQAGAKEITNFIPLPEGGVMLRGGTQRQALAAATSVRLHQFIITNDNAFLLQLSAGWVRVLSGASTVASFAAPYTAAQLYEIQFTQTTDRIILCHKQHPPKELQWHGGVSFSFANFTASGFTYNTVDADGNPLDPPFSASGDYPGCAAFYAGRLWFAGSYNNPQEIRASRPYKYKDFTLYETLEYTTKQLVDPETVTFTGSLSEGQAKVRPTRTLTSEEVVGKYITGPGIPDGVTITGLGTDDTFYLSMSWTSTVNMASVGYTLTTWYNPGTPEYETVTTHRNIVTDECAMQFEIGSDQMDAIQWMAAGQHLIVGTPLSEWMIPLESTPLSPSAHLASRHGSAWVQPYMIGGGIIFAGTDRKSLKSYQYTQDGGYSAPDLLAMARHILTGQVIEIDWQSAPRPYLYAVTEDGGLYSATNEPGQASPAWHRIETAGQVKSIAVLPGDSADVVWLAITRAEGTYLETLEHPETAGPFRADSKTAATVASGLVPYNHAGPVVIYHAGNVYEATGNGAAAPTTIPNGQAVTIGIPYEGRLALLRPNVQSQYGSAQGRQKNIAMVNMNLMESWAPDAGPDATNTERVQLDEEPWTGDAKSLYRGRWDKDGWIVIFATRSRPVNILTIVPEVDAGG